MDQPTQKIVKQPMTVDDALAEFELKMPFTMSDLKHAFRTACKKFHPDNQETGDSRHFQRVMACYELILANVAFDDDGNVMGMAGRRRRGGMMGGSPPIDMDELLNIIFGRQQGFPIPPGVRVEFVDLGRGGFTTATSGSTTTATPSWDWDTPIYDNRGRSGK